MALFRLPSVLLGDAPGDVQEGDELEGDPGLPTGGPHLGEGQRPDLEVPSSVKEGGWAAGR